MVVVGAQAARVTFCSASTYIGILDASRREFHNLDMSQRPLASLGIAPSTLSALTRAGYETFEDLSMSSADALSKGPQTSRVRDRR